MGSSLSTGAAHSVVPPSARPGWSGIVGSARAGLIVARDPEDEDRRVLAVSKMNCSRDDARALAYRVEEHPEHKVGCIKWLGVSEHTARDLLATSDEPRGARVHAVGVLRELLEQGPVLGCRSD